MVSIAAFQAVDPGSIPGRRSSFFLQILVHGVMVGTLDSEFSDPSSNFDGASTCSSIFG